MRTALVLTLFLAAGCADAPEGPAAETRPTGPVEVQSNEAPDAAGPALEATADTTGPAQVSVAGQTVPTRAVVADMESGDRACYLMLRTDDGSERTVYADYSVCDSNAIVGRRVQIEYAPDEIPAASCEGDPECLDTETVALAVAADPIDD